MNPFAIIKAIAAPVLKIIDDAVPDKDLANKLKADINNAMINMDGKLLEAQASIIVAEAKGTWLQSNWRPILMLSIVGIMINNYILFPYLTLFGAPTTLLEFPPELFTLMTVGVGGYVVGRSGEKIAKSISSKAS